MPLITVKKIEQVLERLEQAGQSATCSDVARVLHVDEQDVIRCWLTTDRVLDVPKTQFQSCPEYEKFTLAFRQFYKKRYNLSYRSDGVLPPKQRNQVVRLIRFLGKHNLDWVEYLNWVFLEKTRQWAAPVSIGLISCQGFLHEFLLRNKVPENENTPDWVRKIDHNF